jgi:hypothetical protein
MKGSANVSHGLAALGNSETLKALANFSPGLPFRLPWDQATQ